MAVAANLYATATQQAYKGSILWKASGGDLKYALLTVSDIGNILTHTTYSQLSNEVSGGGYTTGGVGVTASDPVVTSASSWTTSWSATTWAAGAVIKSGTNLYECVVGGTSTGSAPTFPPAFGNTVTDSGGVVWGNIGESITTFSTSTNPSWSSSTISAACGVMYSSTSGDLIFINDFGGTISSTNATFTVPEPTGNGGLNYWFWLSAA